MSHMSTPNEQPPYGQDPSGNDPAATPPGYQPPPGYDAPASGQNFPPAGYPQPGAQAPGAPQQGNPYPNYQQPYQQQPPQRGYQQGGYQQPPSAGDSSFQMPNQWPQNANDVMPAGGFSGIFKVAGLPTMVKSSYIIWLTVGGLSFLGALFSVIASLSLLHGYGLIISLISLVLAAAVIVIAIKFKEGFAWARIALTAIAAVSLILSFFGGGIGWLGILATIFMWLPESSAWMNSRPQNARR